MKIKDLTKEDIENLSYEELAQIILSNKTSKMKIVDIFKKICELKNMSESEFENKVADFYDLISTNKEFLVLEKGYCDLRKNHTPKVIIDEEDNLEVEEDSSETSDSDEDNEDIFYDNSSEEDDVTENDDELSDFMIVDEDDEQNM